jgi:toxin-antitoxin system PIN domain toxin
VILLDANILIYAYVRSTAQHLDVKNWLEAEINKGTELALCWPTVISFLRLVTSTRTFVDTYTIREACDILDGLISQSNVHMLEASNTTWRTLHELVVKTQATQNLVNDAYIAALAIEHGAALCTNDRDFTRFPGLKIVNPIAKH